jgi:polysaccharide biosynthesis protein PslH
MKPKLLVIFPGMLFPTTGMSQLRTIEQIKSLSSTFNVDLCIIGFSEVDVQIHKKELKDFCRNIFFIKSHKRRFGIISRLFYGILYKIVNHFTSISIEYLTFSHKKTQKTLLSIIKKNDYPMVLAHYWHLCSFFSQLPDKIIKVIDTHYVVQEAIEIAEKGLYEYNKPAFIKKELIFNLKKQTEFFESADILVFNSLKQKNIIEKTVLNKELIVTTNGQNLDQYLNYPVQEPDRTLLFYGALGNEFNMKAIKILLHEIIPILKIKIPGLKVLFVGSNAPRWLSDIANNTDFIVTGFVDDIKPFLSKSYLTILPLRTAAGFRGRAIELMALGVPVIGTHNALDCVGIKDGSEGFITDETDEMIEIAVRLFLNTEERKRISLNAREFVKYNYSSEQTFGKLTSYLAKKLIMKRSEFAS